MPCDGCAIAIYCSAACRSQDADSEVADSEAAGRPKKQSHHCGGSSWSHVLPADAVMASLVLRRQRPRARSWSSEPVLSLTSPRESIIVRDVATALLCAHALQSTARRLGAALPDLLQALARVRANSTSITELVAAETQASRHRHQHQQSRSPRRRVEKNKVRTTVLY